MGPGGRDRTAHPNTGLRALTERPGAGRPHPNHPKAKPATTINNRPTRQAHRQTTASAPHAPNSGTPSRNAQQLSHKGGWTRGRSPIAGKLTLPIAKLLSPSAAPEFRRYRVFPASGNTRPTDAHTVTTGRHVVSNLVRDLSASKSCRPRAVPGPTNWALSIG